MAIWLCARSSRTTVFNSSYIFCIVHIKLILSLNHYRLNCLQNSASVVRMCTAASIDLVPIKLDEQKWGKWARIFNYTS